MEKNVFVIGTGVISAIGNSMEECLVSFQNHRSGVDKINNLSTIHSDSLPLAEVNLSNDQLAELTGLKKGLSRNILLSYFAAKQAMEGIDAEKLGELKMGFISGSSVGGMDKSENFFEDYIKDPQSGDLHDVIHHDCGKSTDYVAKELGVSGFITTISTACSSAANSILLGSRMIKAGKLDVVLVGGVDSLTRFTLNGFNSLMIVDPVQCRPFDDSRKGLNLGEGAGYLLLASDKAMKVLEKEPLCKIGGYHNSNDSFHQTAISEDGNGPFLAMTGALKKAGLNAEDIDYINLHGTGTQNNDSSEGTAIKRVFKNIPKISSTKSFTGHTLGASGAIEGVFSVHALLKKVIYPNFYFNESVAGLELYPEKQLISNHKVDHILSNSFGFGGNCTSIVFSTFN